MSGIINGGKEYVEQFKVSSFECGKRQEISVSSLLKRVEHTAGMHLSAFDMSYAQLVKMRTVFLLASIDLKIIRPAKMDELLTVNTWQRGINKVRFLRDTVISDANGGCVAECVTVWFIADPVSHRVKRPREFLMCHTIPSQPEKALSVENIAIDFPDDMKRQAQRRVMYSDLDYNHHVNNTKYADWTTDYVPGGMGDRSIERLKLLFHGEALENDIVDIFVSQRRNTVFVQGLHGRGKCFDAEAQLAERNI